MKTLLVIGLSITLLSMSDQPAGAEKKADDKKPAVEIKKDAPKQSPVKPPLPQGKKPPVGFPFPINGGLPAGVLPPNGFNPNIPMPPNGVGPMMRPPVGVAGGMGGFQFPNVQGMKKVELPKNLIPTLIESLKDEEKSVRQYAASSLVRLGDDAVEPLLALLKGKDANQRANAAYVLGHMGPVAQQALPVLLKTIKDEEKEVRIRVAFALERLVGAAKQPTGMNMAMMGMPAYARGMIGGQDQKTTVALPADPGTLAPGTIAAKKEPEKKQPEKKDKSKTKKDE